VKVFALHPGRRTRPNGRFQTQLLESDPQDRMSDHWKERSARYPISKLDDRGHLGNNEIHARPLFEAHQMCPTGEIVQQRRSGTLLLPAPVYNLQCSVAEGSIHMCRAFPTSKKNKTTQLCCCPQVDAPPGLTSETQKSSGHLLLACQCISITCVYTQR
jgi:hypothetical protein